MARAQFNVLVLPYRATVGVVSEFAVFHRTESDMWQFVAGGGEDDEEPFDAARRECLEEAGITPARDAWMKLDSMASIPRIAFPSAEWPDSVYVVPEHCFAVNVGSTELKLSPEHDRVLWLKYEDARGILTWDSNRVALWELRERLPLEVRAGVG